MDQKWFAFSKAMVAAIITAYIGVTQLIGVVLSPEELNYITGLGDQALQIITGIFALGAGIVAAYDRIRAGQGEERKEITLLPTQEKKP